MSSADHTLPLQEMAYLRGPEHEAGMQTDIEWDQVTYAYALRRFVMLWGDRELLVFDDRRITAKAFAVDVDRFARGLIRLGVKKGDHVAVWLMNVPEYAVAEFAIALLGAAMVPINIRYRKDELEYALKQSDAAVLVMGARLLKLDCLATLREICPELAQGKTASERLPRLRQVITVGLKTEGAKSYDEVLGESADVPRDSLRETALSSRPDDVVILQYTSGTTAFPKAAMLTQGQTLRNAYQMARRAGFDATDRVLSAMPMFHVGGSVCALLGSITIGYKLYAPSTFDAGQTLRVIEEEKITAYAGLEPMYLAIRNHEDFARRSRHSLKKGWTAGTPSILRMVAEEIGIRNICSLYGLSEASPNACISHWETDPYDRRIGTMGRPQPGTEIKVVDAESGETVARGERGEICIRGWTVMKGYYNNPEETARALDAEKWLHTGDAGYVTEDGYLVWTGRIKDMIKVGGENVAAVEVEHLLCTHPKIVSAAVVGVPDARYQEVGLAFVQLKEGETAEEREIIEFCKQRVAIFKVPKYVRFVEQFETTGSGKIQKFLLKKKALESLGGAS